MHIQVYPAGKLNLNLNLNLNLHLLWSFYSEMTTQGGSEGMVSSLGDDSIAPCEMKRYIFTCLLFCIFVVIGLFESPDLSPLHFCFWGWLNSEVHERKLEARRIARSHFGCCCPNKETWRLTQSNDTRSSHAICKLNS
jgi:hypothetical protein